MTAKVGESSALPDEIVDDHVIQRCYFANKLRLSGEPRKSISAGVINNVFLNDILLYGPPQSMSQNLCQHLADSVNSSAFFCMNADQHWRVGCA